MSKGQNIYLIGFSGTGKSSIGRRLAKKLNREFVDTDDQIVETCGCKIPDIFQQEGEEGFRSRERAILVGLVDRKGLVVSTGGGLPLDPLNRSDMIRSGLIICLEAKPDTVYRRLIGHIKHGTKDKVRPLLIGDDPQKRIETLKEYRQPFYAIADWTVHTDELDSGEVVEEILSGLRYARRRLKPRNNDGTILPTSGVRGFDSESPHCQVTGSAFVVNMPNAEYQVFVGWGILGELGGKLRNLGLSGKVALVVDEGVWAHYGPIAQASLEDARFEVCSLRIPSGERSKSEGSLRRIYDWFVEQHIERTSTVVALGGGVIGDLAGYAAATFLRGVPLVHVPTTLLAMTDSAIGGKTAINHPRAKNLIGSFHQPRLVLTDVRNLSTLAPRELASGWAETVKHGMIMKPALLNTLEESIELVLRLQPDITTDIVKQSAGLKGYVVSADERESGLRTILNFGHTIGHALESATEYDQLFHGEAVAIGMVGASWLSRDIVGLSDEIVTRQINLLKKLNLLIDVPKFDMEKVIDALFLDKKVKGKSIRWVLLEDIGKPIIRDDVPLDLVKEVLTRLATNKVENG